jgi:hypothetical protein
MEDFRGYSFRRQGLDASQNEFSEQNQGESCSTLSTESITMFVKYPLSELTYEEPFTKLGDGPKVSVLNYLRVCETS